MWQPIDTAPDNVVVLTDRGTAIRKRIRVWQEDDYSGAPPKMRWFLCDDGGIIPECREEGCWVSLLEPKSWMPFPEVP